MTCFWKSGTSEASAFANRSLKGAIGLAGDAFADRVAAAGSASAVDGFWPTKHARAMQAISDNGFAVVRIIENTNGPRMGNEGD
ncbi:hypothetical protein RMSM_05208 [Rhodopirellula maiorica SM1]|uniref:Uncharacterized protein n=1 Tax=Rhodopirellula maiorica SM1 TaxID=1265738 RepID=M5RER5_9BACT|nr:hypothetical protein RMSM_05208 [Rhodopirellula maiorica SM1]